ncbi:MAG: DUF3014 domain-containing protein [Proteobacteria bacterium]|nr:DUF3014 domain-containing protein [Pseudomonadota bacterium]
MWEDDIEAASRRRFAWLAGLVAAAFVVGGWYWYSHKTAPVAEPAPAPVQAPPPEPAPQISHPIASDGGEASALPALNDSDQLAHDSLAGVLGRDPVEQFLVPQNVIRHVVVTVDNLARKKLAVDLRPIKPTPGTMVVATQGDITTIGNDNYARYAPLMRVVAATDPKALAVVYQHLYPLFQQAYEDLGYPGKYFNDRLVEVIDSMLQAPEINTPVAVVQPKVFYEFADPELEARPAGQKLLIRMGPANERALKAKLRDFRAEIVKQK